MTATHELGCSCMTWFKVHNYPVPYMHSEGLNDNLFENTQFQKSIPTVALQIKMPSSIAEQLVKS